MLAFQPKEENELIEFLAIGEGNYEVIDAVEKVSKNNNPMIKLTLKVWDNTGTSGIIYDYLMLTEDKFSLRKIRHFCYSCGLEDFYNQGQLEAYNCHNKTGKLKIGLQKDKTGQYPDRNIVSDYIFEENNHSENKSSNEPDFKDDDIPF